MVGQSGVELGEAEELLERIAGGEEVAGITGQRMPLFDKLDIVAGDGVWLPDNPCFAFRAKWPCAFAWLRFDLNHAGDLIGGQVGQFFRLHLVKATTIDPALLDQMLAGQRLKVSEDDRVKVGPGRPERLSSRLSDKASGRRWRLPPATCSRRSGRDFRCFPACPYRCTGMGRLLVSPGNTRGPADGQITRMDALCLALLKVSPESGMPTLNGFLREIAIDDGQRLLEPGIAVRFGFDHGVGQVP